MGRMKTFVAALLALALLVAPVVPVVDAALTTKITINVTTTETATHDTGTPTFTSPQKFEYTWASGTGANQADVLWSDTRTINASSSESLDLAGSLTNAFGATVTFAKVKAIIISAASANTNNVQVGGAGSNDFVNWVANASDIVNVRPGGVFVLVSPDSTSYAVTASTGDILKIANSSSGTSVTYTITIIGTSA